MNLILLPQPYFNLLSSVIQLSKLRLVLHLHFVAYRSPASSDSH